MEDGGAGKKDGCRKKKKKDAKFLNRAHLFLKRPTQYSQQMIVIASMMLCSILEHMAEFPACNLGIEDA